jgi:hypothetical protein
MLFYYLHTKKWARGKFACRNKRKKDMKVKEMDVMNSANCGVWKFSRCVYLYSVYMYAIFLFVGGCKWSHSCLCFQRRMNKWFRCTVSSLSRKDCLEIDSKRPFVQKHINAITAAIHLGVFVWDSGLDIRWQSKIKNNYWKRGVGERLSESKQSKINHPSRGLAGFSDVHKSEAIANCESNTNTLWRTNSSFLRKLRAERSPCFTASAALISKVLLRIKSMECKVGALLFYLYLLYRARTYTHIMRLLVQKGTPVCESKSHKQ